MVVGALKDKWSWKINGGKMEEQMRAVFWWKNRRAHSAGELVDVELEDRWGSYWLDHAIDHAGGQVGKK